MKTLLLTLFCLASLQAQTAKADQILGVWLSENKEGKIEVYKTASNTYCGKIVWSKNFYEADGKTLRKDVHNKDESLRSRPIKNMVILTDFVFSDGQWQEGHIYDPKNGKTYSCTIKLIDDALHIRGFIGISLIGRTTIWTRTTK